MVSGIRSRVYQLWMPAFRSDFRRATMLVYLGTAMILQACNSPFRPDQSYSPKLVVYGIAFRGDTTLTVRVETDSNVPISDSSSETKINGLSGTLFSSTGGNVENLADQYLNNLNFLVGHVTMSGRSRLMLVVSAKDYPDCTARLTVLDSGIIYPAYYTISILRQPGDADKDPSFMIYPSSMASAMRLDMKLIYNGTDQFGRSVSGTIPLNPSFQRDSTSYFLRIDGVTTEVGFRLSDYAIAYSQALSKLVSGKVVAVVRLLQIDATLYNYYSISNGFNDPMTMRTEKPLFSNVNGGLGFFASASYDSVTIPVYP